jgi:hypothetical protein
MPKPTYSIENAEAIKETAMALLVSADEFQTPQWIPKSQIEDDSEVYELGGAGTLIVTEWLAKEKGWI